MRFKSHFFQTFDQSVVSASLLFHWHQANFFPVDSTSRVFLTFTCDGLRLIRSYVRQLRNTVRTTCRRSFRQPSTSGCSLSSRRWCLMRRIFPPPSPPPPPRCKEETEWAWMYCRGFHCFRT